MPILTGISRKLVANDLLPEAQVEEALAKATDAHVSLVSYLVSNKILASEVLAQLACTEFGIPLFDLTALDLEQLPKAKIKSQCIDQGAALPIYKRGNRLFIALSDPSNLQVLDDVKFQTGLQTLPIIVDENLLRKVVAVAASQKEVESLGDIDDEELESIDITSGDEETEDDSSSTDDTPIVRFVNKMLLDAFNMGASDIHFEPYEKVYRVRFRVDGILFEHAKPPINLANRLSARLKVMSQLDISERRVPQDGRFKMRLTKTRSIDFRVSTCPTLFGEKIVMRILDPSNTQLSIDELGYEEFQHDIVMRNIKKPQGMVLVTGPTGSGKTVTLYSILNILNTVGQNISTAEDPVELNLQGVNQVNINVKAGLTFVVALRAFLRQDPDVVMVGEIRDLETAEIAVKAAQTGHMVLSTLHTNSAADTLARLMNMGIPTFNLATSVSLIIAQRLCRRLCNRCKQRVDIPEHSLKEIGFTDADIEEGLTLYGPQGCNECNHGYRGRVGIYEVMENTPAIGQIVMEGGNAFKIAEQAHKDGVWTLRESGLKKIKLGLTSVEEVIRVTKE